MGRVAHAPWIVHRASNTKEREPVRSSNLRGKLKKERPEAKIQRDLIKYLKLRGWYAKSLHGGKFQSGMPDIFTCHANYGIRLIEVKLPGMVGSKFTVAQKKEFPLMIKHGALIWILTGATDAEYAKLFKKQNCSEYLLMHLL